MDTDLAIGEKELAQLCRTGAYEAIDAAFAPSKQPLAKLSRAALKLFKELSEGGTVGQRKAITLAALYTVSDAELAKLRFWPGYFDEQIFNSKTLVSVPRERLQLFAEVLLDISAMHTKSVDELCESGLIDKPITNGFVAGLIGRCSWANKNRNGLANLLLAQPTFLSDDVWLLFKFDGTAEHCLSSADKYLTNAGESWESVLVAFSGQGLLDRDRLLDESLRALSRDFNQFRAGWFSRFHEALQPTAAEQTKRLEAYLRLLHSAVPPTVSFALTAVLSSDKHSPIKFSNMAPHLGGALTAKSKQTVLSGIKLLHACAAREPDQRMPICLLACTALVSENAEVQSSVISLLTKFADEGDAQLKSCLATYAPALSASVKKKLPAFLQSTEPGVAQLKEAHSEESSSTTAARFLTPITDLNELVLKAAFVLEHPDAYCDYELVLDGIVRNPMRDQSDFAVRTSSLLQRARKLYAKTEDVLTRLLCELIIVWITNEWPDKVSSGYSAFLELYRLRLEALAERIGKRQPLPMLSLPTDEFGWLEPDELRRRLSLSGADHYDAWDRCFALLRLRNPDAALIDLTVGSSQHAALLSVRDLLSRGQQPFAWSIARRESNGYTFTTISMDPDPESIFPRALIASHAAVQESNRWFRSPAQEVLFQGCLTPNLRQLYFASGAQWLGGALQYTDVPDKAARCYVHFLQDPSISPGVAGSLLLVLAISTGDQDITVAGIDTFIMLIDQQRLDFEPTAHAMHTLFHDGDGVKANRWSKNLGAVAKVSPAHSHIVYELLQHVLSTSLPAPPKDLHYVLELLVELQAEHAGKLQPEVIRCISEIKAGGKTKKLVDQLCK